MPASYLMSWEPTRRRWTKMYRGLRFCVSCRQLDVPETKQDSYQAANEWWILKRAEIGSHHSNTPEIQKQLERLRWAQKHDEPDLVLEVSDKIKQLQKCLDRDESDQSFPSVLRLDGSLKSLFSQLVKITVTLKEQLDLTPVIEHVRQESLWQERLAADPFDHSKDERFVAHQVSLYLANLKDRVDARQYSHGAYRTQVKELDHFVKFLGESTPIDQIDEQKWAAYYQHLMKKIALGESSPGYSKRLHRAAQTFTESLVSLKLIAAPRNLNDRRMRISVPQTTIQVFEREEITRLLSEPGRETVRLFVLLGLNCGMTQIDISDLRHDEIDWANGRLIRKRSKTSDHASAPKVEYPLWSETFDFLIKLRSGDPTRVLVRESGKPWVSNGETVSDSIRSAFSRLKPTLTFKHLRKTAATTLGEHPEFRAYAQFFLAHAPGNVADGHYVKPSQDRFDLAVAWLREQFLVAC